MASLKQYLFQRFKPTPQQVVSVAASAVLILMCGCSTVHVVERDATVKAGIYVPSTVGEYMKTTPDEERYRLVISVADQRMALLEGEKVIREYSISTALKGTSEALDSDGTPRGLHVIAEKIGDGQPIGMIFKGREPTGVLSELNPTSGIPPVVTRLFRLRGLEASNQTTYDRLIYLHGSPHEALLGQPASGGCIRMTSDDVISLFSTIDVGTSITILESVLSSAIATTLERERSFRDIRLAAQVAADSPTANPMDMHRLCYLHTYGVEGVAQNYPAALRWCKLAADRGVSSAMTLLAELHEQGRGTPVDLAKTRELYGLATMLGHPYATKQLAYMQQRGLGGPADLQAAQRTLSRLKNEPSQDNAQLHPSKANSPPP